jgi:hypothetical protein
MSNQLRFNGKSIEEALAKARAALGDSVRLVAAERVSKPGFVGKRVSFTVVVEPPTTPISAPGFAAALRNVLVNAGAQTSAPADADEYDYRSVQDELAKSYGSTDVGSSDTSPTNVDTPMAIPKVFRRDGKVTETANVAAPNWSTLNGSTPTIKPAKGIDGDETELVEAAWRAVTGELSRGSFLSERIDAMVVNLSGDAPVVDLRGEGSKIEAASLTETNRLVAVVIPSASDPAERFSQICNELDVMPERRFVLARRRSEIPDTMLSSTDSVARSVMESADKDVRTAVLVDAEQLRLLRGSFLDSLLSVVVAVEGDETVTKLENEVAPCGNVDALWYEGDDLVAASLGIARIRSIANGSDR